MRLKFLIIITTLILINTIVIAAEIEDDIVIKAFAGKNLTKPVLTNITIEDEAVKNELKNINHSKFIVNNEIIEDTAVTKNPNLKAAVKPAFKFKLIDENTEFIKVKISSVSQIKANKQIKEGQVVTFKIIKDVYKNGEIYIKKDTNVNAYLETLTPSSFGGDPAQICIGRFTTTDINGKIVDLNGEVQKQGANRAIWIRPLTDIASNVHLYAAPLLLLYFVKGGNVKITTDQEFVLYSES